MKPPRNLYNSVINLQYIIYIIKGAEAGGILGVNTPHFFGLTPPTFWKDLKMGPRDRESAARIGGREKFLGGKQFLRGVNEGKNGGLSEKKGHQKI